MRIILLLSLLITFNVDARNIYQSYAVEYDGELKLNTQCGAIIVQSRNDNSVIVEVEIKGEDEQDFDVTIESDSTNVIIKGQHTTTSNWGME